MCHTTRLHGVCNSGRGICVGNVYLGQLHAGNRHAINCVAAPHATAAEGLALTDDDCAYQERIERLVIIEDIRQRLIQRPKIVGPSGGPALPPIPQEVNDDVLPEPETQSDC